MVVAPASLPVVLLVGVTSSVGARGDGVVLGGVRGEAEVALSGFAVVGGVVAVVVAVMAVGAMVVVGWVVHPAPSFASHAPSQRAETPAHCARHALS